MHTDFTSLPLNKQFSCRLIRPDTWLINCYSESLESPKPHVLIGDLYALVIDTTDTRLNLREYIEQYITDKPLMVASTHSHGDHTLANSQFSDRPIFMSQQAWIEIQEMRAKGLDAKKAPLYTLGNYVPQILQEGDVLDLGNRRVEAVSFSGCHSGSSIAYFDHKYNILFPGDELEVGQVLIQGDFRGGQNTVERYHRNLLHLKAYLPVVDLVCPPHNGSPVDGHIIDHYIENCERIMSGIEGDKDIGSMSYLLGPREPRSPERVAQLRFASASRRSEWKGSSLVYSIDRIFDKDIQEG